MPYNLDKIKSDMFATECMIKTIKQMKKCNLENIPDWKHCCHVPFDLNDKQKQNVAWNNLAGYLVYHNLTPLDKVYSNGHLFIKTGN